MSDKTTGELTAVNVSDISAAPDIYDDFKMPGELQGSAVHVTGAQMKQYALNAVNPLADAANADATTAQNAAVSAEGAKTAAQSALAGVQSALDNLPEGDTLIINDLTTGGAAAALSAEMGKTLAQRPNPNLLHNWYFANCVNQRGRTAYATKGYTIDCWQKAADGIVTVAAGYVTIGSGVTLMDKPEAEVISAINGRELTFSVLTDTGLLTGTATFTSAQTFYSDDKIALRISGAGNPYIVTSADVNVIAVKLELGSVQTLAHQDSGGNWVLNEIPDYGETLTKCQRYYQLFTSADKRPTDKRDFRPELRTNATSENTGTVEIDGVTYYYADASL